MSGRVTRRERGEWHFGWILEGRGVQDVWIVPRRSERAWRTDLYEYGTSVRFYDPKIDAWHSTWHGPMHGVIRKFIARAVGDRIVLDGEDARLRWTFRDISADRFLWTNEALRDDGHTWELQQDFVCRRAITKQ
ncbi:hypothetical protein BH10PSE7_BH10PSE7_01960 [soil metagenome]